MAESSKECLYEGMFLLDGGKFANDQEGTTGKLMKILAKAEADVVASRPWMEGKLAYPIDGHRKGLHYLVYFKLDPSRVDDIKGACRLSDVVLRELIIRHPQSLFNAMVEALGAGSGSESEEASAEAPTEQGEQSKEQADQPAARV